MWKVLQHNSAYGTTEVDSFDTRDEALVEARSLNSVTDKQIETDPSLQREPGGYSYYDPTRKMRVRVHNYISEQE